MGQLHISVAGALGVPKRLDEVLATGQLMSTILGRCTLDCHAHCRGCL